MMELFKKAQTGLNLTPGERAALKTMQSLFLSALVAGCMAGGGYILTAGNVDGKNFVYIVIFAILVSFGHGLAKYVTATGDLPLGSDIEDLTNAMVKKIPPALQGPLVIIHQNGPTASIEPPIPASQPENEQPDPYATQKLLVVTPSPAPSPL